MSTNRREDKENVFYIYTHMMEYHSATKRNEVVSFAETWMDLQTIIQSEVNQKEKMHIKY